MNSEKVGRPNFLGYMSSHSECRLFSRAVGALIGPLAVLQVDTRKLNLHRENLRRAGKNEFMR